MKPFAVIAAGSFLYFKDDQTLGSYPLTLMEAAIHKKDIQLFNAFSLAHLELLAKEPPYDFEYISSLANAFCKYCDELDEMGKHDFIRDKRNRKQIYLTRSQGGSVCSLSLPNQLQLKRMPSDTYRYDD